MSEVSHRGVITEDGKGDAIMDLLLLAIPSLLTTDYECLPIIVGFMVDQKLLG